MPYAIQNIKTKKFVYGTDYRYNPPHQFTHFNGALTWTTKENAEINFKIRRCGKDYRVVELEPFRVKEQFGRMVALS